MPETKGTRPQLRYDDQGYAIPFTPAERAARLEPIHHMFIELDKIPDDPNQPSDEEIFRAIDSHRPHRPLFEDCY